jgi:hypothetical protein
MIMIISNDITIFKSIIMTTRRRHMTYSSFLIQISHNYDQKYFNSTKANKI